MKLCENSDFLGLSAILFLKLRATYQ